MNKIGLLLFDIDGVIRNVSNSYRLAIKETVNNFCGWKPSILDIDYIKSEGNWNNDWDLSLEMINRYIQQKNLSISPPSRKVLIECFDNFYFGGEPGQDSNEWSGFIRNEQLLVEKNLFHELTHHGIGWGFVSGAELPSAKFVLEQKLGLISPPLIAMGDAPEKPDPTGFIHLSTMLAGKPLGRSTPPVAYIGDTVGDVKTVMNARIRIPDQNFLSLAIAPPHLHGDLNKEKRLAYEIKLKEAGADLIIKSMRNLKDEIIKLFKND